MKPAPTPHPLIHDPEFAAMMRRLHCKHYVNCLDVALFRGWRGFSCTSCPAYQREEDIKLAEDLEGLMLVAGEVLRQLRVTTKWTAFVPAPSRRRMVVSVNRLVEGTREARARRRRTPRR